MRDLNDNGIPGKDTVSLREYNSLELNTHIPLAEALINIDTAPSASRDIRIYRSSDSNELYAHSTFDIIYVENGRASVRICGQDVSMNKKSMLFIPPGCPYRISAEAEAVVPVITVDKRLMIYDFHPISKFNSVLSGFFAKVMCGESVPGYILYSRILNPAVPSTLKLMISEELHRQSCSSFIQTQLLLCVLAYLSEQNSSTYDISPGRLNRAEQIGRILNYIRFNYRTITLEKLAESFHYTIPYVSKLIRSTTGLTFTEILREIKFDVCRSLLLNSDLKINKIAEVAGFQNTDHFNRIFKKRMGETPTEYKKNRSSGLDK